MAHVTLHITTGPRRRTNTVSDQPSNGSVKFDIDPDEFAEYLKAKAVVDKWQARFRRHRRYGWSYDY